MSQNCGKCISNDYRLREFARVRDEARYWREQARRIAAEVESLKLDAEFGRYQERTDTAWLQGKVVAQARELKRLNDAQNVRRIKNGLEPRDDVAASSITALEVEAQVRETTETEEQG